MPAVKRMRTTDDVRCALAGWLRKLESGEIEPTKARTLIYGAATLASIIKDQTLEVLEERLTSLEAQLKKGKS
jgi:hypothetical protein